jgi:ABC-type lipopolysaccharide export system ATPase subunit
MCNGIILAVISVLTNIQKVVDQTTVIDIVSLHVKTGEIADALCPHDLESSAYGQLGDRNLTCC